MQKKGCDFRLRIALIYKMILESDVENPVTSKTIAARLKSGSGISVDLSTICKDIKIIAKADPAVKINKLYKPYMYYYERKE